MRPGLKLCCMYVFMASGQAGYISFFIRSFHFFSRTPEHVSAGDVVRPGLIFSCISSEYATHIRSHFSPWSFHPLWLLFFCPLDSAGDVRDFDGDTPGQRRVHTAGAGKIRERGF